MKLGIFSQGLAPPCALSTVWHDDVLCVESLAIEMLLVRLSRRLQSVGVKEKLLYRRPPQDVANGTVLLVCSKKVYGFQPGRRGASEDLMKAVVTLYIERRRLELVEQGQLELAAKAAGITYLMYQPYLDPHTSGLLYRPAQTRV